MKRFAVFTDLDGTLLDHFSYDFSPALPAINRLKDNNIPIIPVTSKTRVEVQSIMQAIGLNGPFIVENGAAIFCPKQILDELSISTQFEHVEQDLFVKAFSPSRDYWQTLFAELYSDFPDCFQSFTDMGIDGIAETTGLSHDEATLANQRDFSEPLLWCSDETTLAKFKQAIENKGLTLLEGGRFLHITNGYDKGQALQWLLNCFQTSDAHTQWRSIALGDSGNDIAMLTASDHPVCIKSPHKAYPEFSHKHDIYYSESTGPSGWNEAMTFLLKTRINTASNSA